MPPKTKGKKGKGAKERKKDEEKLKISRLLKELKNNYEKKCLLEHSSPHVELKSTFAKAIDKGSLLAKFVLTPGPPESELSVKLAPLIGGLRSVRYVNAKDIYVWDIHVKYEDMAALAIFFEQPMYKLEYLEFIDCKINSHTLERFSKCLSFCSLTALLLDHNEFGDEGCKVLCDGLEGNRTLLKLSLNYCNLKMKSGEVLGHTISNTAVKDLYLDGNLLECGGLVELLKLIVDRAEIEGIERNEKKNEKIELLSTKSAIGTMRTTSANDPLRSPSAISSSKSASGKKKKKKKKSAKKKLPPEPPKVGPWLEKLHIINNGIDSLGTATKFAPVMCMRLIRKWIANSGDLKELDIDDNLIGDLGGREIVEGLSARKSVYQCINIEWAGKALRQECVKHALGNLQESPKALAAFEKATSKDFCEGAGLSGIKIWVTHRMHTSTFEKIISLSSGGVRKGKKKGRKSGKPGKRKI